ncbi:DUF1905 domain-containing protein [Rathayibacter sp. VKM Ac-2759]|uniref:YdeI/OmpD-associated family protein n=1 Tax=Rathayibacter sp. VKM Ac-2759 TaxID=2609252 RepID=UPI001318E81F|nr:YdeI/OmpD-associated family protein [Rathayibacter sp. VKM Ac-2759]QHC67676.1 DUF1905 domain-containing protein [Rathayibacter sp. VKM Ac-2759]
MRFTTTLVRTGNNTGIEVPPEVLDALGGGRRPAVSAVVNGFAFAGTVGAMGGRALLSFSADKRAATGLTGGETIEVELELDTAPREVVLPEDLAAALAAAGLGDAFAALAPSARKAHATAVDSAKTAGTRTRRIAAIVAGLGG